MRITTANSFEATVANLQRRQQALNDSQNQMTTLKRVNRASDDPTAAARAERALAQEERSTTSQRAVDASRSVMQLGDSALGNAVELLQQVREGLVAAGNGSYSDAERKGLAQAMRQMRAELLAVANSPDGAGSFLFAGQGASSPPFIDSASGVQYRGSSGQIAAPADESLPLTLDGRATWLQAPTGNGFFETQATTSTGSAWISAGSVTNVAALTGDPYSLSFSVSGGVTTYTVLRNGNPTSLTSVPYQSGQSIEIDGQSVTVTGTPANGDRFDLVPSSATLSVFDVLDRTATQLDTPLRNSGQVAQTVAFGLRDVDALLGRLQTQRSKAGETLNRIDRATSRLSDSKLAAQTDRSQAEDLDMVEAISKFQQQQTSYSAALQSYSSVQQMSMFQYLKG